MQKIKGKGMSTQGNVRRKSVNPPALVSIDELSYMTDDEVITRLRTLEDERAIVIQTEQWDPRPWEEELAYVKRELQMRRTRKDLDEKYRIEMEKEHFLAELNLPVADLDNSAFLKAVYGSGWMQ